MAVARWDRDKAEVMAQIREIRECFEALEAGLQTLSVKIAKAEGYEAGQRPWRVPRKLGPVPVRELAKGIAWMLAALGTLEGAECAQHPESPAVVQKADGG